MKNSKINNERLIASSIAAAILAITGSTIFIGVTTVTNASNIADTTTATEATTATQYRVNNGEITAGMSASFWCTFLPWCGW